VVVRDGDGLRGDFARANQVLVTRRMHRPTAAVVHDLREHAEHRFTPPGTDWHAPLTDLLVHRLDVTVPLRLRQDRPPSEHQVTLKDATQAQRDEAQREHSAAWRAYGDTVTAAGMDHYVRVDETPVTMDRSDPELMGWRLDDGPWHSARLRPT